MQAGSWVQETAFSILTFILRQLAGEWSDQAWEWFSTFFAAPVAMLDDPLVRQLTRISVGLVLGALPVAIAWLAIKETVARLEGTAQSPPEALVQRTILTGAAVTATSLAAWFMVTIAEYIRDMLAGLGLNIDLLRQFFASPLESALTVLLLAIVFLLGAVVLTIQRAVMAAEFAVLLIVGPIMAAGLIREGGQSGWSVWVKEVLSILITPLIQMVILQLFLIKGMGAGGIVSTGDRAAALAFLYVLWNTPSWARKMVYTAGVGERVGGAAATVYRLAVVKSLMRATFKV